MLRTMSEVVAAEGSAVEDMVRVGRGEGLTRKKRECGVEKDWEQVVRRT